MKKEVIYWIVFFDENGRALIESNWAHVFYYKPDIRELKENGYTFPKLAKGYMILTAHQFWTKTWEQIEFEYSFGLGSKL